MDNSHANGGKENRSDETVAIRHYHQGVGRWKGGRGDPKTADQAGGKPTIGGLWMPPKGVKESGREKTSEKKHRPAHGRRKRRRREGGKDPDHPRKGPNNQK